MQMPDRIKNLDIYDTILIFLYIQAAAGIYKLGLDALVTLAVATVAALAVDASIYKLRRRAPSLRNLRKALITAAFVGFLVPPGLPLYIPAIAAALAVLSKHIIHLPKRKHLFNPAAFGSLAASLLFAFPTAWWGTDLYLSWLLGFLLIYKFRRLELPIALLATYSILSTVSFYAGLSSAPADRVLLENIPLVMMAFFMATEPVTSPFTRNGRTVFGVMVGVFVFALGFLGRFDSLLGGLLLANLFVPLINSLTKPKIEPAATQPRQNQIESG